MELHPYHLLLNYVIYIKHHFQNMSKGSKQTEVLVQNFVAANLSTCVRVRPTMESCMHVCLDIVLCYKDLIY